MDQPQTGICSPVAGLVLAAPAYFIPSQGLMKDHCLLRSAALSACGTVCGKGTEVDLAKKIKPKEQRTILLLCRLAYNHSRRNVGEQQGWGGVVRLNVKCLQVVAAMPEGMIPSFPGCTEQFLADTQPSGSANIFNSLCTAVRCWGECKMMGAPLTSNHSA